MTYISKNRTKVLFVFFIYICFFKVLGQEDSIPFYQEKIKNLKSNPNFSENQTPYIDLLNGLSYQMRYTRLDTMKIVIKKAKELSQKINYKKGELESLANYSAFHLYIGQADSTIQYCKQVISSKHLSKFPIIEIRIYNQMGQAYFIQKNYPLTFNYFLKGLSISERNSNDYGISLMNMNLGTMFNLLEDHNEALKYYLIAHDNSIKLNHPLMTAMIASNLGSLYIKTGELKKAAEYLTKSIFDFKNLNNKQWLAFSYTTMGELYIQSKEYNNALDYYKLAMNEHNSVNDIKGKADLFYGLSRAYFGINDLEKAEKNVLESQKLYSSFKLDSGLEKVYRVLYEIKKQQKEIEKSLEYLEEVEKLSNDNFKRKNKVNLNMLNVKLQFEKETEHLKAKNKLALDKQRKYLKWSLAAFITSLLIVLIVLNANKREKLLIKKLENNAVVLNESQKALIAINNNQDKLFSIVGHDLRGPIISFNELLKLYIEDPKGKEYFEKFAPQIKSDLDYLQLTTDNLLYWGKTQMKGNLSKAEHILVKKEIDLILQLYRNELNKKTIEVDCQIKKTDFVTIDINQFNVIFRNILSNAIKFTPNGGKITLSTTLKDTTLVIKVSDTGVGMSQETVNKLFNNEAHISTKGTNFEKGTGLGLRLVKELINNNNGSIVVQSQLNIGSNFIIELPHLLV